MKRAALLLIALSFGACSQDSVAPTAPTVPVVPVTPLPPMRDLTPPPVPQPVSPANGAALNHFPRETTLVWSAVDDPSGVTYRVQVQWDSLLGGWKEGSSWCPGVLTGTSCSFNFIGAQPGRWRVRAVDGEGNESAYSPWYDFRYLL